MKGDRYNSAIPPPRWLLHSYLVQGIPTSPNTFSPMQIPKSLPDVKITYPTSRAFPEHWRLFSLVVYAISAIILVLLAVLNCKWNSIISLYEQLITLSYCSGSHWIWDCNGFETELQLYTIILVRPLSCRAPTWTFETSNTLWCADLQSRDPVHHQLLNFWVALDIC